VGRILCVWLFTYPEAVSVASIQSGGNAPAYIPGGRKVVRLAIRIGAAVVLVVMSLLFLLPVILTQGPMPVVQPALESGDSVVVEQISHVVFTPTQTADTGVIIYPGGFVDPRSYAPAGRAFAEAGLLVVIVEMPLNLAVLGSERAESVISDHREISRWVIAGHSLGGSMAARYVSKHPQDVGGLVLWAAYPENSVDLRTWPGVTTSVFGTRDGLTSIDEIEASRDRLPADTRFVAIGGGNHAQFGWYGSQRGDNPATISRSQQQQLIIDATLAVVEALPAAN